MSQALAPPLPGCSLEWRHGVALAFPVLFLPGERDVAFSEPGANQQEGRWVLEGIFWGRNNRTEEGDRLVSSGVKF